MIRVVLAVLLTVALLAAVTPAIDESRTSRTAIHLNRVTERVARAANSLVAHEDPTAPGVPGARRLVRLRLLERSWTAVDASLWVDGEDDQIGYRLAGERPHRTTLREIDLRTPNGPIRFDAAGRYRLELSLVRADGVGVVVTRG
ncbi:hypothetical protein SAMN04488065_0988 [Haloplanus vescus]|uniref:DUF7311 domain-containing protein n=1 Tax=Haloplanus vescus TaxID=555874 RepID=A0A1H3WMC5_9EURY|nr:hypothetical protein [Haloplanus vescus]SDZ88296.1 hypothetical protein SAMN04488065_0988 [Haloplanus vescus]